MQAAEARALQLGKQSEAAFEEARGIAVTHVAQAEEQAALILQRARAQADRITRSSEREVTAASARRDSINVQLDNLRQMLATLGGPAVAEQLLQQEWAAPLGVGSPHDDDDVDGSESDESEEAPTRVEHADWYETLQNEEAPAVPVDSPVVKAVDRKAAGAGSQARARS